MLMNKRSQFTKIFSQAILDMKDTGRFDIFQGEISRHKDQSCKIPDPKETPLGYKKLVFLFALLALGIFISLFVALFIFISIIFLFKVSQRKYNLFENNIVK